MAGLPPQRLAEAARLGRASGTDAASAALRAGLVDEARFYRALSQTLGVPFASALPAIHPDAAYPRSVVAGFARLDAPTERARFAMAPGSESVAGLLAAGVPAGAEVVIVTPTTLREGVMTARGRWIARDAAEDLRNHAPDWAYTPNDGLGFLAGVVALGLGIVALVAFLPVVGVPLLALANLGFLAMTAFRLAALVVPARLTLPEGIARADDRTLPTYTVIVPLHREAQMVRRLLAALSALDYPVAKLDIKIVIEADDHATRAALAAAPLPARFEVIVSPPGLPRTKPRALNVTLPLARGDLLVVFDAEDVPDPGQLRDAAAVFARSSPLTACLQGRLVVDNRGDGWLPRLFALEYAALFDVLGPALAAWRLPYPLGGTSTHFRIAPLRALHGWDSWNVTEDADLGLRLAMAGYHVGDLPSSTYEEGLRAVRPFLRQRSRWMKGFMQTAIVHVRRPAMAWRALGPLGCLGAASVILGTVTSALAYPVLTLWALLTAAWTLAHPAASLAQNLPTALGVVLVGAGIAAMILPAALGAGRRGWWRLVPLALLMPLYYALVSVGAWLGFIDLLRAPSYWAKTEHGLARSSTSGLRRVIRARGRAPSPRRPAAAAG